VPAGDAAISCGDLARRRPWPRTLTRAGTLQGGAQVTDRLGEPQAAEDLACWARKSAPVGRFQHGDPSARGVGWHIGHCRKPLQGSGHGAQESSQGGASTGSGTWSIGGPRSGSRWRRDARESKVGTHYLLAVPSLARTCTPPPVRSESSGRHKANLNSRDPTDANGFAHWLSGRLRLNAQSRTRYACSWPAGTAGPT
jgi:hypothetical protein